MRVPELKRVIDIDNQISRLHQELAVLYDEREHYLHSSVAATTNHLKTNAKTTSEEWCVHTYKYLASSWSVHGIKIPSFTSLKKSLSHARSIMASGLFNQPELSGKLGILLVPPTKILGAPGAKDFRKNQPFISLDDYVDSQTVKRPGVKEWQLYVVYNDPVPLNYGTAAEMLVAKSYLMGNQDTRGLGIHEYYALSLQTPYKLDENTWTLLLNGCSPKSRSVTSVTFINGQYRFEVDESDTVFGDQRFRPAIRVTAQ